MADEKRDAAVNVMVTKSVRERAEKAAGELDRTVSWLGATAIEEYLERHEAKGRRK